MVNYLVISHPFFSTVQYAYSMINILVLSIVILATPIIKYIEGIRGDAGARSSIIWPNVHRTALADTQDEELCIFS